MKRSKEAEALFTVAEEIAHENVPNPIKKAGMLKSGVTCLDTLLKMKNGANTTIKLALDHEGAQSNCIFTFRILTSQEEYDLLDEMANSGLTYLDIRYKIKYTAKTLSMASVALHEKEFITPQLTEADLMYIPKYMLLELGNKYNEFIEKHSPKLEQLTQQDIDQAVAMVAECEDDIKKYDLLNGWNLRMTQELLIDSVKKLTKLTKQAEAVLIGS